MVQTNHDALIKEKLVAFDFDCTCYTAALKVLVTWCVGGTSHFPTLLRKTNDVAVYTVHLPYLQHLLHDRLPPAFPISTVKLNKHPPQKVCHPAKLVRANY